MDNYYTTQEVAEILKVNPRTVLRWISAGKLKATKLGNLGWRVSESTLKELLEPSDSLESSDTV